MEALQYIFTSWKNGDLPDKGYMIYSKSEGITEAECDDIKKIMRYTSPRDMKVNPTPEEIQEDFPFSFAYFRLTSGRHCIAQSTYLGKDYSGRFGNYIIYALVFQVDKLEDYPTGFFGEEFMKTSMTNEELEAIPPIPPLLPLQINETGSIVNLDSVLDFAMDQGNNISIVISSILEAKQRGIPFFINDIRENLVMWCALVQNALPQKNALNFYFDTYVCNHEDCRSPDIRLDMVGIRPDAYGFNYSTEKRSSRYFVADFISGNFTEGLEISRYAEMVAEGYMSDWNILDEFNEFLLETSYAGFDQNICYGYDFYLLCKQLENEMASDDIVNAVKFGIKYGTDDMNAEAAAYILGECNICSGDIEADNFLTIVDYFMRYVDYMNISIYEVIYNAIYQYAARDRIDYAKQVYEKLKAVDYWQSFIGYCQGTEVVEDFTYKIEELTTLGQHMFYLSFIADNFCLDRSNPQSKKNFDLLNTLLNNVLKTDNSEKVKIDLMRCFSNSDLYSEILLNFTSQSCSEDFYSSISEQISEMGIRGEKLLDSLLKNPDNMDTALTIMSASIRKSVSPESDLYSIYRRMLSMQTEFDISPVVKAYITVCDKKKIFNVYADIIDKIDMDYVQDDRLFNEIMGIIAGADVKSISKLSPSALRNIIKTANPIDGTVIRAVMWAQSFNARHRDYSGIDFDMSKIDKKQYVEYMDMYFYDILVCINDQKEVSELFKAFNCERYIDLFNDCYMASLKKMKRKKANQWDSVSVFTAEMIIDNSTDYMVRKFEEAFVNYMARVSKDDQDYVEDAVRASNPGEYTKLLFTQIRNKETVKDKIFGGLFKKKTSKEE